jgi:hypothetical protein
VAEALLHAEIPIAIRSGRDAVDRTRVHCQAITDVAEPIREQAAQMFLACTRNHAAHSGEWRSMCWRALESLRPDWYPRLGERHGVADHVAPVLDREPLIREYPRLRRLEPARGTEAAR